MFLSGEAYDLLEPYNIKKLVKDIEAKYVTEPATEPNAKVLKNDIKKEKPKGEFFEKCVICGKKECTDERRAKAVKTPTGKFKWDSCPECNCGAYHFRETCDVFMKNRKPKVGVKKAETEPTKYPWHIKQDAIEANDRAIYNRENVVDLPQYYSCNLMNKIGMNQELYDEMMRQREKEEKYQIEEDNNIDSDAAIVSEVDGLDPVQKEISEEKDEDSSDEYTDSDSNFDEEDISEENTDSDSEDSPDNSTDEDEWEYEFEPETLQDKQRALFGIVSIPDNLMKFIRKLERVHHDPFEVIVEEMDELKIFLDHDLIKTAIKQAKIVMEQED